MHRKPTPWVVTVLAVAAVLASTACSRESATADPAPAAVVEEVAGSEQPLIRLTEAAAGRTGIETVTIAAQAPLSVPYSALLYDPDGDTWVYTGTAPLTYTRHPVTVEDIDGDLVILTDGPPPGTEVVTVGVAELYGVELGIGQ